MTLFINEVVYIMVNCNACKGELKMCSRDTKREKAYSLIDQERERQKRDLASKIEYADSSKTSVNWTILITKYANRLDKTQISNKELIKERILQVAALAVAALENDCGLKDD